MDKNPAAELVDRLIEAGCDICALGTVGYSLADPLDDKEVSDRIHIILEDFGPRDHLFGDIIAYLNVIGRQTLIHCSPKRYINRRRPGYRSKRTLSAERKPMRLGLRSRDQ